MHLRSLELQGFKSFADKTLIRFDHDITAIVGPNGSGKSNISDAIRWVMGEMSTKELRGGKMEDVIFGGTAKRSPLGFAEATLTLDNSDHSFAIDTPEVMITRRYYRSGESEYYINKQSARLRDITELFFDTGLGKEGYSNIGQGKIDEIVSLKSTDRREVFEEAAGISKFRHRKDEAERRLAATQDNLLRIGDKISELELQVEPLRAQAETAQKYLAYRSSLKGLEITVWLDTLSKLRAVSQKAEEDYRSASFVLSQHQEALTNLYSEADALSEKLNEVSRELEMQRETTGASEHRIQQIASDKAVLEANLQSNREAIARIRDEMADESDRTNGIYEQIAQQRARIEAIRAAALADQEALQQLLQKSQDAEKFGSELDAKVAQLHAESALLQTDIAAKKAEISSIELSSADTTHRREELESDLSALRERKANVDADAAKAQKELDLATENATAAKNAISGYLLRQQTREQARDTKQKQLDELTAQEHALESRVSLYEAMQREYEGFSKAVKTVMQEAQSGGLKGVHAPISDLISVSDEHALAVETALGGALQDIVVDNRDCAKAGIRFLKRVGGRVTFAPLDAVQGKTMQESGLQRFDGFVGIASELVSCDKRYDSAVKYYLGHTVVAEDLDAATAMARHFQSKFKIVTLDGQVLHAGGTMTGGTAAKSTGVLSRKNALIEAKSTLEKVAKQRKQAESELQEATRQAEEVAYQISVAQQQQRQAEDAVLQGQGRMEQFRILLEAVTHAVESDEQELAAMSEKTAATQQRIAALSTSIADAEQRVKRLDEEATKLELASGESGAEREKLNEQITEVRLHTAAGEAECASIEQSLSQLQLLSEQMRGNSEQKQQTIAEYEENCAGIESQIAESVEAAKLAAEDAEAQQLKLKAYLDERMAIEQKRTAAQRDAQEKSKELLLLEREAARLEQKKTTADMEEKQLIDKLWDNYELTPSTAEQEKVEIESLTAANRAISDLRRKITGLGTPNLGAIEEFERVNERYTYLTSQRDDVEHAKRDLEEIIRSIVTEMREIFLREFGKINEYFGKTFTEMFGGGKASLELEDPEDPLGCGIEIRVQPPGKQLKTITLLSGGEKAFVAIALYFAILKVRPSSFCLLDEIDAALDDANVRRFSEYLRNLSDKTQFIVITHRRGTMEVADMLYGVTMQERGVSTMINIDLNELEKQIDMEGTVS